MSICRSGGRDALGAFFRTASVLVMTSVTETQCLVVQEAAAFGLPVVVIDGGANGGNLRRLCYHRGYS